MTKVKTMVEAGVSIPTAIKESLGMTLAAFADKYNLLRPHVSDAIQGARRPTVAMIDALIAELGGTEDEWRELLWIAARPARVSA